MRDYFQKMIGGQLIKIFENGDGFSVRMPDGNIRNFEFVEDYGDCCGYNEFSIVATEGIPNNRLPVITNIVEEEDDVEEGNSLVVTFFGEYAPMCQINSYSSSGSGWCYGASVSLRCRETEEETPLTEW